MLNSAWQSGYPQPLVRLLYERNNAISNADRRPCTVCGHRLAFQPHHTVF